MPPLRDGAMLWQRSEERTLFETVLDLRTKLHVRLARYL
jgi:hypothetical protein